MKKNIAFVSLLAAMLLASCTSYKKVPYLQDSDEWSKKVQETGVYEPKIQPYDLLNILVMFIKQLIKQQFLVLLKILDIAHCGAVWKIFHKTQLIIFHQLSKITNNLPKCG